MSGIPAQRVNIVGAGLAGALLAVLLARRGFEVTLYERRPDPRSGRVERGRSINLALAARGIRALERAGLMDRVRPLLIPMRGRMVHEITGTPKLVPYGQRPEEVIHSVGRAALNLLLIEEVAKYPQVKLFFEHTCLGVRPEDDVLQIREDATGRVFETALTPTIATDGAGSAVRASLRAAGLLESREEPLGHDYKELTIPPVNGRHALDPNALHVWPRGGFMLIALPNTDGSFTATLFLAREGTPSFAALRSSQDVRELFATQFPDVVPLIPALLDEFRDHPQGQLGTVYAAPWRVGGKVILLGDAAHAIVPFHGQGMNAAFEDCLELDLLLDRCEDWSSLFAELERRRKPNSDAIARMALENYVEMRDTVRDPRFLRLKALSLELERRHPDRFIPRYSMVMFHPEIPYAEALRRGAVQERLLDEIDARAQAAGGTIDYDAADALIHEHLPPVG
ncbi:MAG: NAD(P)/FAD-dependent oxidoreductase [Pseudomonadota bacterium]|jgi:2-polyprenyl-6-methoxyphenol hydroxylase and related FAD-dependent oxidoreductases|nr:MAG: hypothetical protein DIU56_14975 [Pseudomonadota bacterium]